MGRLAWTGSAAVLLVTLTVVGCGGAGGAGAGGNSGGAEVHGTGSICVAVKFPKPRPGQAAPADLPNATRSVVLWVYDPAAPGAEPLVAPVVITRQSGQSTVQGTVQNVPAGDVLLRVEAFDVDNPDVSAGQVGRSSRSPVERRGTLATSSRRTSSASVTGSSRPIAEAETIVTVAAGQTTRVTVVTSRLPTELRISGPTEVDFGQTVTYVATAHDADGNVILGTLAATFSSSNPSVLAVAPGGQAHALRLGTATVHCEATWDGRVELQTDQAVTIGLPPSAHLLVAATPRDSSAPNHALLESGDSAALSAEVSSGMGPPVPPASGVTWTSSDPNVAEVVSDGSGAATVQAQSVGVATVTATFGSGSETLVGTAEIIVMPPDAELLAHILDAQLPSGAFARQEGSTTPLGLGYYGDVAAGIRVLGGTPRDVPGLANYIESLYDPGTHFYRARAGATPEPWPTHAALRTHRILHAVMPSFPHPEAIQALEAWAAAPSGYYDAWGYGKVVTVLCDVFGPSWPDADSRIAQQILRSLARADGSYEIGEVLHTYCGIAGLRALGSPPVYLTRTTDFLRSSQTSGGYFAKGPGRTDWDWLHEAAAVAGLYLVGSNVPNPWAMKRWWVESYLAGNFPIEPTVCYAEMALTKKLLERDPLAIQLWVDHNYD